MKSSAVIRIVIWSVIALLLTAVLVVGIVFRGSFNGIGDWNLFSFAKVGSYYADADEYTAGNASLTDPVSALEINWRSGTVSVTVYDGDTVELKETGADDDSRMYYRLNQGTLTVQFCKSGMRLRGSAEKQLTVKLPLAIAERLDRVKLSSASCDISVADLTLKNRLSVDNTSGKITVNGVTCGDADFDMTSADVFLSALKTGSLSFDKTSGSIKAADVTADELSINSTSGSCTVAGTFNKVKFNGTSGEFTLTALALPSELETDCTSGDIRLILPEGGFTAEVDTASGDFNCEYPTVHKGDRYICGDGSADFSFDAASGNITIEKLK